MMHFLSILSSINTYGMTLIEKRRKFEKNVRIINSSYKKDYMPTYTTSGKRRAEVSRDGTKILLQQIINGKCFILAIFTTDVKISTDLHFRC